MDYSKFYTPLHIAEVLVKELKIKTPVKAIDICCGSCNLLKAVKDRWEKVTLYGTDIYDHSNNDVTFFNSDGRKFAIAHQNEFSLVVANPPFDSIKKQPEYAELFSGVFENIKISRLEIEMLIANIMLLNDCGTLLIIMPSSFVEAESYIDIRCVIAKNYYINSVIKLPEDTFGTSCINSYALIIENRKKGEHKTVLKHILHSNKSYSVKSDKIIENNDLINGHWTNTSNRTYKKRLDIKRGNISSSYFISRGQPILHTSKKSDIWQPSRRCISKKIKPSVFAEKGDIIVSRIGKASGQWCVYQGEKIPISDCLYRVKDPDGKIFAKIRGRQFLDSQKGVATRYITMQDFESWINDTSV